MEIGDSDAFHAVKLVGQRTIYNIVGPNIFITKFGVNLHLDVYNLSLIDIFVIDLIPIKEDGRFHRLDRGTVDNFIRSWDGGGVTFLEYYLYGKYSSVKNVNFKSINLSC